MTVARPHTLSRTALALAATVALSGCAMDTEARVRAELGDWVSLGETLYFDSRLDCTAAVFGTRAVEPRAGVDMVRTLPDGLRRIEAGETVGFDLPGHSPNMVSEALMSADLPGGLGLLASGVSGKNCMTESVQRDYLTALMTANAVMIYAPGTNALAVLDVTRAKVFFARGDV